MTRPGREWQGQWLGNEQAQGSGTEERPACLQHRPGKESEGHARLDGKMPEAFK